METTRRARGVIAAAGAAAGLEVPALSYLVVGLLAAATFVVMLGLRLGWQYTFGLILLEIEGALSFSILGHHFNLGGWAGKLNNLVLNNLAAAADHAQGGMGYFFHGAAVLFEWGIREVVHYTNESLAWASWLQHVHLPRYIKWAIYAAVPPALIYRIAKSVVHAELPRITRTIKVATHTTEVVVAKYPAKIGREVARDHTTLTRLGATVAALAGTLVWPHPLDIPSPVKLWRGLTSRMARVERRLRRLEALLGATGMAVAMANVLGLANPRCLRSGPLGKVSRALCGLGSAALNDLLGLLVDAAILSDPCDTMTLLADGAHVILSPIEALTEGLDAAFGRCGYDLAPPLKVASVTPPPLQVSTVIGV